MCWNCDLEHDYEGCGTIGWPPPTGVKSSGVHCELSRQGALQSGPRSATGTCVSILCLTHRLCRYDVSSERHAYAEGRTVELPENEETHPPVACGCVDKACRNMCAVEHQVEHYDAISSQTLFQDADADSAADGGLQIAVMLRSDVFRHARARQLQGKPSPVDIYDIVNDVVAEHLAAQPLILRDFADVVRHAVDEEPASASDPVPRRRRKRKAAE